MEREESNETVTSFDFNKRTKIKDLMSGSFQIPDQVNDTDINILNPELFYKKNNDYKYLKKINYLLMMRLALAKTFSKMPSEKNFRSQK